MRSVTKYLQTAVSACGDFRLMMAMQVLISSMAPAQLAQPAKGVTGLLDGEIAAQPTKEMG
jgi:hypothetical protein